MAYRFPLLIDGQGAQIDDGAKAARWCLIEYRSARRRFGDEAEAIHCCAVRQSGRRQAGIALEAPRAHPALRAEIAVDRIGVRTVSPLA